MLIREDREAIAGRDGEVLMGMTLRCSEDGADYIVTVSGIDTTPGANFANALRAAAAHVERVFGIPNSNEVH